MLLSNEKKSELVEGMRKILETRKSYREGGINKDSLLVNLSFWKENKNFIENVLMNSEYYDKDRFAIVKPVKVKRVPNYIECLRVISVILRNYNCISSQKMEGSDYYSFGELICYNDYICEEESDNSAFIDYLNTECEYIKRNNIQKRELKEIITGYRSNGVDRLCEILIMHCGYVQGCKFSRIVTKLFNLLFDKDCTFNMEVSYPKGTDRNCPIKNNRDGSRTLSFDKLLAQLTDMSSDKEVEKYLYISFNPCDYLSMSHLINGNSSCHGIRDSSKYSGCYHAATLTTMVDNSTVISFFLDKDVKNEHYLVDKTARSMIHLNANLYIMNRPYPFTIGNEQRLVQEELEHCMLEYYNSTYSTSKNGFTDFGNYGEYIDYWGDYDCIDINKDDYLGYADFAEEKPVTIKHISNTSTDKFELKIGGKAVSLATPLIFINTGSSLYTGSLDDFRVDEHGNFGKSCRYCGKIHSPEELIRVPHYEGSTIVSRYYCKNCYDRFSSILNGINHKEYAVLEGQWFIDCFTKEITKDYNFKVLKGIGICSNYTFKKYASGLVDKDILSFVNSVGSTGRIEIYKLFGFSEEDLVKDFDYTEKNAYNGSFIRLYL